MDAKRKVYRATVVYDFDGDERELTALVLAKDLTSAIAIASAIKLGQFGTLPFEVKTVETVGEVYE